MVRNEKCGKYNKREYRRNVPAVGKLMTLLMIVFHRRNSRNELKSGRNELQPESSTLDFHLILV